MKPSQAPPDPWVAPHPEGLVLRPWKPAVAPAPLVACVILRASDLSLLLERFHHWHPAVDRTVVVLGAWSEPEGPSALEATRATLTARIPGVQVVMPPPEGWPHQVAKRSAYFAQLAAGEIGFVVDADEELLEGPEALRQAAREPFDVGWVTISAPRRYERSYGQPRFFRVPPEGLEYRDRHYWVFARDGRLVATHSYGGPGWLSARLPLTLVNRGGHRRSAHQQQFQREAVAGSSPLDEAQGKVEALRVLQLTRYDAGLAVYRLHSAINATTRERSLLISDHGDNPLRGPTQFALHDRLRARAIATGADVLHCHLDYQALTSVGGRRGHQAIVIHHHGSIYRADPKRFDHLDQQAIVRFGSTMDLLLRDESKTLQWLPNPVPVALYAQMAVKARAERRDQEVWIAHSPSKPKLKGTADLIAAVERLRAKRLPIRLQMTTGVAHGAALWMKASCDIMFDSFWLGIQCSGIEAAAMGMPVVAGDVDTATAYQDRLGAIPYTFATPETLEEVLARLVTDTAWRAAEAARVRAYVLAHHDEAAVARRYLEVLRSALKGAPFRTQLHSHVQRDRQALAKQLRVEVKPKPSPGTNFRMGPRIRPL